VNHSQPLPSCIPLLPLALSPSKGEHATEYSKAATRGNWNEVWDNFDRRKGAKAANDMPTVEGDEDMFARAGVAVE